MCGARVNLHKRDFEHIIQASQIVFQYVDDNQAERFYVYSRLA